MAARCADCAEKLSLTRRLLDRDRCEDCEERHEQEEQRAREARQAAYEEAVAEYDEVLDQLRPGADLDVVLPRIRRAAEVTPLAKSEVQELHAQALSDFLAQLIHDDVLTKHEEILLATVGEALDARLTPAEAQRYIIAACNAGLMPRDRDPQILLNQGEVAYWRTAAALLSKHVIKEYRTDFHSLSVPIGKSGVRYRGGYSRGRQVVVGTRIEAADHGWLSATNQRIVFAGREQTMEFPLHRLVGLNVFGDGIGLQIANRQSVPTFRTGAGNNDLMAAVITAATALDRGTFVAPATVASASLPTPAIPKLLAERGFADATQASPEPAEATAIATPPAAGTPDVEAMFSQLEKFPGTQAAIANMKALHQLGGSRTRDVADLLDYSFKAAVDCGFPPSLTPYPLDKIPPPPGPVVREVPDEIAAAFTRLAELLTPSQLAGLREDFRRGLATEQMITALEGTLAGDQQTVEAPSDSSAPLPPRPATDESAGHAAVLVYERTGVDSRTRELLDVLAASDSALTPEEIGRRMWSPDGTPVPKASVRAAIRNLQRVEKGLREDGAIGRAVLVIDWSNYDVDGANRYSLAAPDKAAILRLA